MHCALNPPLGATFHFDDVAMVVVISCTTYRNVFFDVKGVCGECCSPHLRVDLVVGKEAWGVLPIEQNGSFRWTIVNSGANVSKQNTEIE